MTRDYDKEAKDHPEHNYSFAFDYMMHEFMLRTFAPYLGNRTALEMGCFKGNFTRLLTQRYAQVEVVDASAECISVASATVGDKVTFHQNTFETFDPTSRYENIFLIHTLEHLNSPVDVLRRVKDWLAPEGRLFVATPNAHAASRQIAVNMGLIRHAAAVTAAEKAHGHCITYTLDTLGADISEAGLSKLTSGGVFFKALANFQLDEALRRKIISEKYMNGCYLLGQVYPDLCSSIYYICEDPDKKFKVL